MPTDGINSWAAIMPPRIMAPSIGAVNSVLGFSLQTSAFVSSSVSHTATDWEIRTGANGSGTVTWSSMNDVVGKLLKVVPALALATGQVYYIRSRFRHASGQSAWSADVRITT